MPSIYHYVANSTGDLDKLQVLITKSLRQVIPIVEKELDANQIDIIFVSAPDLVIPEYGIGGNAPGPNHLYVSFDPSSDKITQQGLNETLLHEIHHCIRYRKPGYGKTLGEAMISEGLASLYEEEYSGETPMYAKVQLSEDQIAKANKIIHSKNYDHTRWFFGNKDIDRWFGYTYGYNLAKTYSDKTGKKAFELVHTNSKLFLDSII
jgi:uncharacterized protein YjaZ